VRCYKRIAMMKETHAIIDGFVRAVFERGKGSEAWQWIFYWFVQNDGWIAIGTGILTGLVIHGLACSLWVVDKRRRPRLPTSILLTKAVTWFVLSYSILPWYSLGIGAIARLYSDYWFCIELPCALSIFNWFTLNVYSCCGDLNL